MRATKLLSAIMCALLVMALAGCDGAADPANPVSEANPPVTGNGTFELTLTVPNQEVSNYAEFTVLKNGSAVTGYAGKACTLTDEADDTVKAIAATAEGSDLESGSYDVVIKVYTDEFKCLEVCSVEDTIQIAANARTVKTCTKAQLDVDVTGISLGTVGEGSSAVNYVILGNKMYINGNNVALTAPASGTNPYADSGNEEVYIGDGITGIGNKAFNEASSLKKVTGAVNVASIGDRAFRKCTALEELPAFDSVTVIGEDAFYQCNSVTEINGFNALLEIPTEFWGRSSENHLKSVSGFASITKIGTRAFHYCTELESFSFDSPSFEIGASAFQDCASLHHIVIPAGATLISSQAFLQANYKATITILNKNIVFKDGAWGAFLGFGGDNNDFAGEIHFAGTMSEWKAALGLTSESSDDDYRSALETLCVNSNFSLIENSTGPDLSDDDD